MSRQLGALALIVGTFLTLVALVALPLLAGSNAAVRLPVDIRARSEADYSGERSAMSHAPMGLALIADVLRDIEPGAGDINIRMTAVANQLTTPVPTLPENGTSAGFTATPTGSTLGTPPTTSTATGTGSTATASPTPGTATVGPSPTSTPTPTTNPSGTATSTNTPNPTASGTTAASPTPTKTPIPASPTATVDACSQTELSGFHWSGPRFRIELTNGSGSAAAINGISLDWPEENTALLRIDLDGDTIYDQADGSPPTNVSGGWAGGDRSLGGGATSELLFEFDAEPIALNGYDLTVSLSNGCTPDFSN